MTRKLLIICDIDGTLANLTTRMSKAGLPPSRRSRKNFQVWLDLLQHPQDLANDPTIPPILHLVQLSAKAGTKIVYVTGRADNHYEVTKAWLKKVRAPKGDLIMRSTDDWRSAADYKKGVIRALLCNYPHARYDLLTIDDDPDGDCTAVYQKLGIVHLKVFT